MISDDEAVIIVENYRKIHHLCKEDNQNKMFMYLLSRDGNFQKGVSTTDRRPESLQMILEEQKVIYSLLGNQTDKVSELIAHEQIKL